MLFDSKIAAENAVESDDGSSLGGLAGFLSRRISAMVEFGRLTMELPSGTRLMFVGRRPGPHARIEIRKWKCIWRIIAGGAVGFGESYVAGEWSSPHINALLGFALRNSSATRHLRCLRAPRCLLKIRHALNRNTRRGSRKNIAAHYDLGNEFFAGWLDAGMNYSSALFSRPGISLEAAQSAKLDRVLDLLELSGRERVLEIGCGWGALAECIIARYGCSVTGLTLSANQLEFARQRLQAGGSESFGDLRLQDYRDVRGSFDRMVSIEMIEAVGEAYWPAYFRKVREGLRADGIALLQVITIDNDRFENYRRRPDFIQKYIFPGGMLPSKSVLKHEISAAGLDLVACEFFGSSYALTLGEWQARFQSAWPTIARLGFGERFKRIWEFYFDYCRAGFEAGALDVGLYKIVHARPA